MRGNAEKVRDKKEKMIHFFIDTSRAKTKGFLSD